VFAHLVVDEDFYGFMAVLGEEQNEIHIVPGVHALVLGAVIEHLGIGQEDFAPLMERCQIRDKYGRFIPAAFALFIVNSISSEYHLQFEDSNGCVHIVRPELTDDSDTCFPGDEEDAKVTAAK
jgi:hypothetical protein